MFTSNDNTILLEKLTSLFDRLVHSKAEGTEEIQRLLKGKQNEFVTSTEAPKIPNLITASAQMSVCREVRRWMAVYYKKNAPRFSCKEQAMAFAYHYCPDTCNQDLIVSMNPGQGKTTVIEIMAFISSQQRSNGANSGFYLFVLPELSIMNNTLDRLSNAGVDIRIYQPGLDGVQGADLVVVDVNNVVESEFLALFHHESDNKPLKRIFIDDCLSWIGADNLTKLVEAIKINDESHRAPITFLGSCFPSSHLNNIKTCTSKIPLQVMTTQPVPDIIIDTVTPKEESSLQFVDFFSETVVQDIKKFGICKEERVLIVVPTCAYMDELFQVINQTVCTLCLKHDMINEEIEQTVLKWKSGKYRALLTVPNLSQTVQYKHFRLVYHYGTALSLSTYINDIGRACYDRNVSLARLIFNDNVHKTVIQDYASCDQFDAVSDLNEMRGLVLTSSCKRLFLSRKLGGCHYCCLSEPGSVFPCCSCINVDYKPITEKGKSQIMPQVEVPIGYVVYETASELFEHLRIINLPNVLHGNNIITYPTRLWHLC
jgi:superfamily II DNA helicase RecQ